MATSRPPTLQQLYPTSNPCFGCGPNNSTGLHLECSPAPGGDGLVATWRAQPHHAGPEGIVHGGLQGTLIDCQAIWTAMDAAAREQSGPVPMFVTAEMHLTYHEPVHLADPLTIRSHVERRNGRRWTVTVELRNDRGTVCTTAEVVCHRLDQVWSPNPYST